MQVIDCHCHAGIGDGLTGPWDTRARIGTYLDRAREAGIHRTVIFSVFSQDYGKANRCVARLVAANRERLIGFLFLHAAKDHGRIRSQVAHAVRAWGFRGIKVHKHDAPISREICEAAREFRLPVLYDVMGDVPHIGLVAREYPGVRFIVPHLGSFGDDWKAHEALIDLLVRFPNIYADTSGVRRFDFLQEAVERAGAGKILFGSDGPFLHPALELQKIHLLRLPPRETAKILGENLLSILPSQDCGCKESGCTSRCTCNRCHGRACGLGARRSAWTFLSPS